MVGDEDGVSALLQHSVPLIKVNLEDLGAQLYHVLGG